jgi:hypothetical protein
MQTYYIIWPEKRWVLSKQIEQWYSDAVANNDLDADETAHKEVNKQAMALHRAGLITLGHQTVLSAPNSRQTTARYWAGHKFGTPARWR